MKRNPGSRLVLGRLLLLACSATLATGALSQVAPPEIPIDSVDWTPLSPRQPAATLKLGGVLVHFEDTTLDTVRRAVGVGRISHRGDASSSLYWLCYSATAGRYTDRIWIMAGEMGGISHEAAGVAAQRIRNVHANRQCPELPLSMKPVSLSDGLWLGASGTAISQSLGQPSHIGGVWQVFSYQHSFPNGCRPGMDSDITNNLFLRSEQGAIQALYGWKVTSC